MEDMYGRCFRLAVACAFAALICGAPGRAHADPGVTVYPGMEIHQGSAVCMVGLVEPRLRVALTTGQCDGGGAQVTDRDHHVVGEVVLVRRQADDEPAAGSEIAPVEYEVIALARDVTASDLLPTGRHLLSSPGLRAQPGLPVCQFRRSTGEKCGTVGAVSNGRFVMADMAVDSRDYGGPVYALTGDNDAVIVGLFEGMWRSTPEMESWQAIMAQVFIDGGSRGQQPLPQGQMIACLPATPASAPVAT